MTDTSGQPANWRERDSLTIAETAPIVRLSRRAAYRAAALGNLPGAYKLGDQWRVSVAALRAAVDGAPAQR